MAWNFRLTRNSSLCMVGFLHPTSRSMANSFNKLSTPSPAALRVPSTAYCPDVHLPIAMSRPFPMHEQHAFSISSSYQTMDVSMSANQLLISTLYVSYSQLMSQDQLEFPQQVEFLHAALTRAEQPGSLLQSSRGLILLLPATSSCQAQGSGLRFSPTRTCKKRLPQLAAVHQRLYVPSRLYPTRPSPLDAGGCRKKISLEPMSRPPLQFLAIKRERQEEKGVGPFDFEGTERKRSLLKAGFWFALEREGIGVSKGREKFCLFLVLGCFVFFSFSVRSKKRRKVGWSSFFSFCV